ncbi:MAG: right-handed parallel beta-helix repeat-containing protein [Planctomycetes bacterium]|nr:right-handed parallel beta-helix repeat-containing protein [Planctomycetota bacterium]
MSTARFSIACVVVVAAAALAAHWSTSQAQQAPASGRLPGAVATIDAANYPSIQAAIDALPKTGGVVQLPAGTFEINEPLVVEQEDTLLIGQGTGTNIKNVNTAGKSTLVIRPKGYAENKKARVWRVQVQNLRLTGNEKCGHGIDATGINEIFLNGITVSYHGGHGIRLDQCYEDPRVCNSLITYNKQSGLEILGGHDIVVAANHFEENLDAVRCLDSFNLCMSGNNVDDHLRHGVVIENTYGSIVSSNMIEECEDTAIILDRDCYGITLAANVIAHHKKGGIDLRDAHGCSVTGNSFPLVWARALAVGPESDRITITGNTFSDSYVGQGRVFRTDKQPSSGIILDSTTDIVITGNTFAGLQTKAVELAGKPSRRVTFTGNVLTDVDSDVSKLVDSQVSSNITSASPAQ